MIASVSYTVFVNNNIFYMQLRFKMGQQGNFFQMIYFHIGYFLF